jgi:hypothetical protein
MTQTEPLLAPLADWHIGVLASAVVAVRLAFLISKGGREFTKHNVGMLAQGLPSIGDAATFVGLLLAALAILATTTPTGGVERFEAAFLFVGVGLLSLFASVAIRPYISPWSVYLSEGLIDAAWYNTAWGVFALVDSLLPSSTWRLSLLAAPAVVLAASVYTGWLKIRSN